jgi:hypothetical protein
MKTAAELRGEAERLRQFAKTMTDHQVLETIQELIDELERRARRLDEAG